MKIRPDNLFYSLRSNNLLTNGIGIKIIILQLDSDRNLSFQWANFSQKPKFNEGSRN